MLETALKSPQEYSQRVSRPVATSFLRQFRYAAALNRLRDLRGAFQVSSSGFSVVIALKQVQDAAAELAPPLPFHGRDAEPRTNRHSHRAASRFVHGNVQVYGQAPQIAFLPRFLGLRFGLLGRERRYRITHRSNIASPMALPSESPASIPACLRMWAILCKADKGHLISCVIWPFEPMVTSQCAHPGRFVLSILVTPEQVRNPASDIRSLVSPCRVWRDNHSSFK